MKNLKKNASFFQCAKCPTKFSCRRSFIRHWKNNHENTKKFIAKKEYQCAKCLTKFSWRESLIKHWKGIHENTKKSIPKKKYQCAKCPIKCSSKYSFERHMKNIHETCVTSTKNCNQKEYYECSNCTKRFNRKDNLRSHILYYHLYIDSSYYKECYHCDFRTRMKNDLCRHIRIYHVDENKNERNGKIVCLLCKESFKKKTELLNHLEKFHNVNIEYVHLQFTSGNEFNAWKENIEKTSYCRYVKSRVGKFQHHITIAYRCHRTGFYKGTALKNKHCLNYQGSKKLNGHCPAEIKLRVNKNGNALGSCSVEYLKTHMGHDVINSKELAHLFMNRKERKELALKIAAGVSNSRIIQDNELPKKPLGNQIIHILKEHDVMQNARSVGLCNTTSLTGYPVAVDAFVNEMGNSVLYYKKQGMRGEGIGKHLHEKDFVLVLMTELQESMLKKYGSDVVAVDGTHGTNKYDFLLQALLVLDDYREGFPTAFAISNRYDEVLMDVFLTCVRNKVGVLHVNVLISDMQETCANSWGKIMTEPKRRIFCTWHVHAAWREHLKLVPTEKRTELGKELYDLSTEVVEDVFLDKFITFINSADKTRTAFLEYFNKYYIRNVRHWAYCYRVHAGVNTNMYIEAFFKKLKYKFAKGLNIKELWKGLAQLKRFLQRQMDETIIKEIKIKLRSKLRFLRERHEWTESISINGLKEVNIIKHSENQWFVSVPEILCRGKKTEVNLSKDRVIKKDKRTYLVEKVKNTCVDCKLFCEKCQVCFHEFICYCVDAAIRNIMCKHIHALGMHLLSSDEPEQSSAPADTILTTYISVHSVNDEILAPQQHASSVTKMPPTHADTVPQEPTSTTLSSESDVPQKEIENLKKALLNILNSISTRKELQIVKHFVAPIEPSLEIERNCTVNDYEFSYDEKISFKNGENLGYGR